MPTYDGLRLLLLVADGVRPDVLEDEMAQGRAPALADLAQRGGAYRISTSFPSVTGPGYVPFTMGRHPGEVGLPGLRWFDRARTIRFTSRYSRSYAGPDIWFADYDVAAEAPTIYELARPSLAAMAMLSRGTSLGNVGRGVGWMIRAAAAHFRGDAAAWRRVEQSATHTFFRRFAAARPRLSTLAITSADKNAHAFGCDSPEVRRSIADMDAAVARAYEVAQSGGWRDSLRVWVVGDHGHAPVTDHDDLHAWFDESGYRTSAHPKVNVRNADIALMVGGNAMAHLYLEPQHRTRQWWPSLRPRWQRLHDGLLARPSIDLVIVAHDDGTAIVSSAAAGSARIRRRRTAEQTRWDYVTESGDPLGLGGSHTGLDACTAWQLCDATPYPDAVVQALSLACAARSGDIIVSASAGWDLRARFEPVPHVSTHGALLRDQMTVPLLLDAPPARQPLRSVDVTPSALDLLGIRTDAMFDGRSFV